MTAVSVATASRPTINRSKLTNNPLKVRADGRTPQGRRLRDLFRSYHQTLGRPSEPAVQAAILAAAELMVAAETARAALLAGTGDVDQVVRLENLSGRAVRKLGIRPGAAPAGPSLQEYLASRASAPPVAPSPPPAVEQPAAAKAPQEPPQREGEATEASDP
jgi:hypothetical protein